MSETNAAEAVAYLKGPGVALTGGALRHLRTLIEDYDRLRSRIMELEGALAEGTDLLESEGYGPEVRAFRRVLKGEK